MKRYLLIIVLALWLTAGSWQVVAEGEARKPASVSVQALRTLLNSERIELKFGSYAIEVIKNNQATRVSNLYSTDSSGNTTRTLAVVRFAQKLDSSVLAEHNKIVSGQSLGAVFKRAGWKIDKEHIYFGELAPSKTYFTLYSLMRLTETPKLSIHIYNFVASRGGKRIRYATIAEIHHPEYLTLNDLNAVYLQAFANNTGVQDGVGIHLSAVRTELESLKIPLYKRNTISEQ